MISNEFLIYYAAGTSLVLLGMIIGAVSMYQSFSSRIMTYFIKKGMSVKRAREKMHEEVISLKYKYYRRRK